MNPDDNFIVIRWDDGSFSAAERIDTAKIREEMSDEDFAHIQIEEDYILYNIENRRFLTVDEATARIPEWHDETLKRMEMAIQRRYEVTLRRNEFAKAKANRFRFL